jgi:UDP-N-acetylmuramoyl-tripeptide--D-alanyl-D-alanine ligase
MMFEPEPLFLIMSFVIVLTLPFWFVRMIKGILFYVFLWQVKEYRLERFVDHFRTEKGKQLIFNKLVLIKIILLVLGIAELAVFLYAAEAVKFIYDLARRRVRGPVPTKKARALVLMSIGVVFIISIAIFKGLIEGIIFGQTATRLLLGFDILLPVMISIMVVGLQPFTVLVRNRTLAKAKARRAQFKNLKVIGITGSYGKTSTKEFLAHILSAKFNVAKTPEHQNSEFGVANTILRNLTNEHEVFVCEMGAYKKGEIKVLAEVAQPQIGIVTGVNEQHLATFGSMENLLSAEGGEELLEALPGDGTIILNGKNKHCQNLYKKIEKSKKVLCTVTGAAAPVTVPEKVDIQAGQVRVEKERVVFEVEGVEFRVSAYGGHSVENLLLAIAAAKELGMTLEEIAKAAETMPLELSALKVKKGINGATVIDSTYSANPNGVIADLEYLSLYEGKKVLIMPCLIELGNASKEAHKRIGEKIGQVCDLAIITTQECFEDVKEGLSAVEARDGSTEVLYTENAQEILEKGKSSIVEGGTILLEGGKESRLQRQLVSALKND